MPDWDTEKISKREYLVFKLMADQAAPIFVAIEAVASVELSHPDEDWSVPEKTLAEWVAGEE